MYNGEVGRGKSRFVPRLSINDGEEKRACDQMYMHALDIAAFHSLWNNQNICSGKDAI